MPRRYTAKPFEFVILILLLMVSLHTLSSQPAPSIFPGRMGFAAKFRLGSNLMVVAPSTNIGVDLVEDPERIAGVPDLSDPVVLDPIHGHASELDRFLRCW